MWNWNAEIRQIEKFFDAEWLPMLPIIKSSLFFPTSPWQLSDLTTRRHSKSRRGWGWKHFMQREQFPDEITRIIALLCNCQVIVLSVIELLVSIPARRDKLKTKFVYCISLLRISTRDLRGNPLEIQRFRCGFKTDSGRSIDLHSHKKLLFHR